MYNGFFKKDRITKGYQILSNEENTAVLNLLVIMVMNINLSLQINPKELTSEKLTMTCKAASGLSIRMLIRQMLTDYNLKFSYDQISTYIYRLFKCLFCKQMDLFIETDDSSAFFGFKYPEEFYDRDFNEEESVEFIKNTIMEINIVDFVNPPTKCEVPIYNNNAFVKNVSIEIPEEINEKMLEGMSEYIKVYEDIDHGKEDKG